MTRRAYLIREKQVVCFWSPKAGNSSLGVWLAQGLWAEEWQRSGLPFREFLVETKRVAHFARASKTVEKKGFDSYALVRNPYDRAISAYINKFLYDGGKSIDRFDYLEPFAQDFVVNCAGRDPGEGYRGISFVEFLEVVAARVSSPGKDGEPRLNVHWNTQIPFGFRSSGFRYGQIMHLESIEAEITPLQERLGISEPFPHRRPGRDGNLGEGEDLSTVSSLEIVRAGMIPSADNLLTPTTRSLIEEAYAIDFDILGYGRRGV